MCDHKVRLSHNDRRFLKSLRIAVWDGCPVCPEPRKELPPAKLRVEKDDKK